MNSPLSEAEASALRDALEDEYKAQATYQQVIEDLGPVRPFVNIVEAETRHVTVLLDLFARYGLPVPENTWAGRTPRFATRRAACEAGAQAEVENAALYDRLLASTQRPDILFVFRALRSASQERHLPAFRRCLSRQGGQQRKRMRHRRGQQHP